jgi:hypothetical protein
MKLANPRIFHGQYAEVFTVEAGGTYRVYRALTTETGITITSAGSEENSALRFTTYLPIAIRNNIAILCACNDIGNGVPQPSSVLITTDNETHSQQVEFHHATEF